MLNPVFSINHMRHMTPLFYEVCHKVRVSFLHSLHPAFITEHLRFCILARLRFLSILLALLPAPSFSSFHSPPREIAAV